MTGVVVGAARLIPLCLGCIATGMYWITLVYCLRWLLYTDDGWKLRKKVKKGMLFITLAMFALSTLRTSMDIATTFAMVRTLETGIPNTLDPTSKFGWAPAVTCTATNIAVLIADAFLIYRCWIVHARSLPKIIFPCLFWVGGIVCTILQLYSQVVEEALVKPAWTPVNMSIGPGTVLTPFWACTIVVNIYATGMIVHRIWKATEKQPNSSVESTLQLRSIIRILVESGVLYLLITIPHFISWWTQSGLTITILSWINVPVTCSAFNLIIIRIAQRRADIKMENAAKSDLSEMSFVLPTSVVDVWSRSARDVDTSVTKQSAIQARITI